MLIFVSIKDNLVSSIKRLDVGIYNGVIDVVVYLTAVKKNFE